MIEIIGKTNLDKYLPSVIFKRDLCIFHIPKFTKLVNTVYKNAIRKSNNGDVYNITVNVRRVGNHRYLLFRVYIPGEVIEVNIEYVSFWSMSKLKQKYLDLLSGNHETLKIYPQLGTFLTDMGMYEQNKTSLFKNIYIKRILMAMDMNKCDINVYNYRDRRYITASRRFGIGQTIAVTIIY